MDKDGYTEVGSREPWRKVETACVDNMYRQRMKKRGYGEENDKPDGWLVEFEVVQ